MSTDCERCTWKSIDTADKDEYVLAIVAGTKLPMVAVYDEEEGWIAINGAFNRDWKPTHWIRWPASPSVEV